MAAAWITLIVTVLWAMEDGADAGIDVGVCYGMVGDNLPPATDVINLYKKFGIDAMVDAFFSAMEKASFSYADLVVSASGWPSARNGGFTTPELASTYNKNFLKLIVSNAGTPKRPNTHIEGFILATFNENLNAAGVEQNFGLFYPNMQPVHLVFS